MKTGYIKNTLLSPAIALGLVMAASALSAAAQTPVAGGNVALRDQSSIGLRAAAEKGLSKMMFDLSQGQPANAEVSEDFPIATKTYGDLRKVSLGVGFEVNTIDPAALMYASKTAELGSLAHGTGVWKFVILSQGKPVGLLEMNNVQGSWQAVGAGSNKLAQDIVAAAPKTGDGSFRFIRIYQATSDLMEVRGTGKSSQFVPMQSAQRSLPIASLSAKSGTLTSQDLLPSLQSAVRGNLQRAAR